MSTEDQLLEKYAHIDTNVDMLTEQARAVIALAREGEGDWEKPNA
ncbi:MAG: hypothetical protein ACNYVW_09485 [Methanosarcinales archaeon]